MENNELFQTIERLKESLSDVESARRQVSETVSAYKDTRVEINSFVSKLGQIEQSLSGLIDLLQNNKVLIEQQASQSVDVLCASCEEVIKQTQASLNTSTTNFEEKNNQTVNDLKSQISRFNETVDKAGILSNEVQKTTNAVASLSANIKSLQAEIKASQKTNDKAFRDIDTAQKNMTSQLSEQDNSLAKLSQAHSLANTKLGKIDPKLQEVQKSLVKHTNNINDQIAQKLLNISNSIDNGYSNHINKMKILKAYVITNLFISIVILIIFIIFILKKFISVH